MSGDRLDWVAARDGLAHATRPRSTRTLCGARPVIARFAWPSTSRCAVCSALAMEAPIRR